jgi:cell wall-associated NlpC family hydrolase
MTADEVELLRRAHALFEGAVTGGLPPVRHSPASTTSAAAGAAIGAYRHRALGWLAELDDARRVDAALAAILGAAASDHGEARRDTGAVLASARADAATVAGNPILARELLRRKVIRLRQQHSHVRSARRRARRRRTDLRELRYRHRGRRDAAGTRRADAAVRAALTRLGRPYVWGATGPDRFDCSGLVQWAYARTGVRLPRTTYQQIYEGAPVARSQVRPGDLVFPHTGHVQIAIGGGLVVEAPQPGATVQISRMGPAVAIRRVAG